MSVKKEITLQVKLCVIIFACVLTASMTWILAKRKFEKQDDPSPPPINKWKIALLSIGALWMIKKMMTGFRWIQKKLKILEQMQKSYLNAPPMDSEEYSSGAKRRTWGFDRNLQAPRQRARAAMGIDEPK